MATTSDVQLADRPNTDSVSIVDPTNQPVSLEERDRRVAAGGLPPAFGDDDDEEEDDEAASGAKGEEAAAPAVPEDDPDWVRKVVEGKADEKTAPEGAVDDTTVAADDVLESAKRYGLPTEGKSPEVLAADVAALDKLMFDEGKRLLAAEAAANPPPADVPDPKAGEQPRKPDGTFGEKPLPGDAQVLAEFGLDKLTKDEYAPELVEPLLKIVTALAELRSDNQADKARRAQAAELAAEQEIEGFYAEFVEKNPEWEAVFGKGSGHELKKTAKGVEMLANRIKHLDARDTYATGLRSRNQPIPVGRTLLAKALHLEYPDKVREFAEKKAADRVKRRGGGPMPRPGGPSAPAGSTRPAKPTERIAATMSAIGMPAGD